MNSNRKTALIVGILFIIATFMLFVGEAFYKPILGSPDYLETAYSHKNILILGILIEFICAVSMGLIPAFLFPILKKHYSALALGYLFFRFLEAILIIITNINKLSLINLSRVFLEQAPGNDSYLSDISHSIEAFNYWAGSTGLLYLAAFTWGAMLFYSILFRSNLMPRWLSIWGFSGAALLFIGALLIELGLLTGISPLALELILALPIAINEMLLALWLIFRGFNPAAWAANSAHPVSNRSP